MTIREEIQMLCDDAKEASTKLALVDTVTKNNALLHIADAIMANSESILSANQEDLKNAADNGVPQTMIYQLVICNGIMLLILKILLNFQILQF